MRAAVYRSSEVVLQKLRKTAQCGSRVLALSMDEGRGLMISHNAVAVPIPCAANARTLLSGKSPYEG